MVRFMQYGRKKSIVLLLAIILLAGISCKTNKKGSDTASANEAMRFTASMKIGWNLGNTLDAHINMNPSETSWGNPQVTQEFINGVAAQGFGAVRIPVTWGSYIYDEDDYEIDDYWLSRVAAVAGYVLNAGMKAIINIHHDGADSNYWLSVRDEDLTGPTKAAIDEKFTAVWKQIAQKFKDQDENLIFEAFNELHDGSWGNGNAAQHKRINELNQIFVDTVRAAGGKNSSRYLVIPGWVTRASVTVSSLVLPSDKVKNRLIVTFHFYDPYDFTGSAKQEVWGDKALPSNWANERNVRNTFDSVRKKFVDNGIPVIIGEYGAVNQWGDAFKYRKYYLEYVTKYAHDYGFVPFYWDNGGFGYGSEKFGLLNRDDGAPDAEDEEEILSVMMKAVNDNYTLESITAP